MLRYQHTVTVGTTQRVPFICDRCNASAEAIVTVKSAGFATSDARHDSRAADAAVGDARERLATAVPRLAELAACPHCGHRSAEALAAAKGRGVKAALAGLAALAVGLALAFGVGGGLGWSAGGFIALFGLILGPLGLFAKKMSITQADRSVRFELPHPEARPPPT